MDNFELLYRSQALKLKKVKFTQSIRHVDECDFLSGMYGIRILQNSPETSETGSCLEFRAS